MSAKLKNLIVYENQNRRPRTSVVSVRVEDDLLIRLRTKNINIYKSLKNFLKQLDERERYERQQSYTRRSSRS